MTIYNPGEIFSGEVLIIAPHMDDEVLACGGTIAHLPRKEKIHLLYATDGTKSPVPMFSWMGKPIPNLSDIRTDEAKAALAVLGVPDENIRFLALPDGNLKRFQDELVTLISKQIKYTRPDHIFLPFRFDRHPDHLATTRATYRALQAENSHADVLEYFVYYRYRLLPGRDIRKYVRPEHIIEIDIKTHAAKKKEALQCFESQTKIIFNWQERPILTKDRVEEVSYLPEVFLRYDRQYPGPSVFINSGTWIRFVHRFEPLLKDKKERALALLHWQNTRNGR
jgi:LmbE family N-acetylglucosaminyl deacetylase